MILGHEAAGVVESVGENVTEFQPGDHVITLFLPHCKKCRVCKHREANCCEEFSHGSQSKFLLDDGTTRFTARGQQLLQFLGVSSFSEYTVMKDINLVKINPAAALDVVCLLSCGFATGYGGSMMTAKVEKESTCAVFGLGGIGLATVLGCKHSGATKIIGVDTNDAKKDIALEMGCTDFVNPMNISGPVEKYLNEKFGAIDYTFECVGCVTTIQAAFHSVANGGLCVIIGVPPQELQLNIFPIEFLMGKKLVGEVFGSYKGKDDIPQLVDKYLAGDLPLERFISHRIKLDEINNGFDMMKQSQCLRCIIKNE